MILVTKKHKLMAIGNFLQHFNFSKNYGISPVTKTALNKTITVMSSLLLLFFYSVYFHTIFLVASSSPYIATPLFFRVLARLSFTSRSFSLNPTELVDTTSQKRAPIIIRRTRWEAESSLRLSSPLSFFPLSLRIHIYFLS